MPRVQTWLVHFNAIAMKVSLETEENVKVGIETDCEPFLDQWTFVLNILNFVLEMLYKTIIQNSG